MDNNYRVMETTAENLMKKSTLNDLISAALEMEFNGFNFEMMIQAWIDCPVKDKDKHLKVIIVWYCMRGTTASEAKLEKTVKSEAFKRAMTALDVKKPKDAKKGNFTINRLAVIFPDLVLYTRSSLMAAGIIVSAPGYDQEIHPIAPELCWPGGIAFCKDDEEQAWLLWYESFQEVISRDEPKTKGQKKKVNQQQFIQYAKTNPRVNKEVMRNKAKAYAEAAQEGAASVQKKRADMSKGTGKGL
jgi:hypothetical protein